MHFLKRMSSSGVHAPFLTTPTSFFSIASLFFLLLYLSLFFLNFVQFILVKYGIGVINSISTYPLNIYGGGMKPRSRSLIYTPLGFRFDRFVFDVQMQRYTRCATYVQYNAEYCTFIFTRIHMGVCVCVCEIIDTCMARVMCIHIIQSRIIYLTR